MAKRNIDKGQTTIYKAYT